MNMRYIITGGAGFIGSHLCEALLKSGHEVICIDNLSSGSKNNIAGLLQNPKFEFIKTDVSEPVNINDIQGNVDGIFHMASMASPPVYQAHPVDTMKANSFGTYNLLQLAMAKKARFIFASTSEVYGDPAVHPQKESYWGNVNPVGIRSCYDESKRFGEALVNSFNIQHKTKFKLARIFNTYGPKMDLNDGRVVPNFLSQAIKGKPITVYGDGLQTRSFCYIDDMVKGLILLMDSDELGPINLGNPDERKIIDFAKLTKTFLKSKSEIVFRPLPKDDPMQRCPDITLARKLLKWNPKVRLEDGLAKTAEWFKKDMKA